MYEMINIHRHSCPIPFFISIEEYGFVACVVQLSKILAYNHGDRLMHGNMTPKLELHQPFLIHQNLKF
jgi:hypothetical protein